MSLMFGLLAGTLNGAANGEDVVDFNKDDTTPTNTGQAICVLDIKRFAEPAAFKRQVDSVIRQLHGSALLPGFDRIRLPGEDRAARFAERTANGIPIPGSLKAALDAMAGELGIAKLLGWNYSSPPRKRGPRGERQRVALGPRFRGEGD
jgi:L-2-hydroxycarboxylate dehydrogenase (NAD+)